MSDCFTTPEPGRHVHYFADVFADALAAIVTDVTSWERGVNEKVFVTVFLPRGGFQYKELTLCQPYDRIPQDEFLTWMPHTINGMKKKAEEEKARQDKIHADITAEMAAALKAWDRLVFKVPSPPAPVKFPLAWEYSDMKNIQRGED